MGSGETRGNPLCVGSRSGGWELGESESDLITGKNKDGTNESKNRVRKYPMNRGDEETRLCRSSSVVAERKEIGNNVAGKAKAELYLHP
jgi:hypothetical protein